MGRVRICWQRLPTALLGRTTACLLDGGEGPVAAVFDPTLARPVAAVLDALRGDDGARRARLDDARADLAHYLAERLGLEKAQVAEALEWAIRRAGVEVIPDEIEVEIQAHSG